MAENNQSTIKRSRIYPDNKIWSNFFCMLPWVNRELYEIAFPCSPPTPIVGSSIFFLGAFDWFLITFSWSSIFDSVWFFLAQTGMSRLIQIYNWALRLEDKKIIFVCSYLTPLVGQFNILLGVVDYYFFHEITLIYYPSTDRA